MIFEVEDVIQKYVKLTGVNEIFYVFDYHKIVSGKDIIVVKDNFGGSLMTNIDEIQEILEEQDYPELYI